jgi:transcriptional antiterminator RfaH
MTRWYVLSARPRAEILALHGLTPLSERGLVESYLPKLPPQQRNGKLAPAAALFPGYLFCRCDLDAVPLSVLRVVPGVRRLVEFGDVPAVVPDDAVALVRERLAVISRGGGLPSHPFHPGDAVQIRSGPLRGLYAIFDGPMRPSERVQVLVELLGRVNTVSVPSQDLELVGHPPRRTRGHGRWLPAYRSRERAGAAGR